MTARADDQQISALALGLLVKPTAGANRDDIEELRLHVRGVTLSLEQRSGILAIFGHLTLVHTDERQFSVGVGEERGKRDGILAIGSAVHSHEHVLEHHESPCRGR